MKLEVGDSISYRIYLNESEELRFTSTLYGKGQFSPTIHNDASLEYLIDSFIDFGLSKKLPKIVKDDNLEKLDGIYSSFNYMMAQVFDKSRKPAPIEEILIKVSKTKVDNKPITILNFINNSSYPTKPEVVSEIKKSQCKDLKEEFAKYLPQSNPANDVAEQNTDSTTDDYSVKKLMDASRQRDTIFTMTDDNCADKLIDVAEQMFQDAQLSDQNKTEKNKPEGRDGK